MKKIMLYIMIIIMGINSVIANAANDSSSDNRKILKILTWSGYFDPEIIKEFEQKTGYSVYITVYYTDAMKNELLNLNQLYEYDLIVGSAWAFNSLVKDNKLAKIKKSQLMNVSDINKQINLDSILEDYIIPISYSGLGVIYNKKIIEKRPDTWKDVLSPNAEHVNGMMLMDKAADTFDAIFISMFGKTNIGDTSSLYKAAKTLESLIENGAILTGTQNRPDDLMLNGKKSIGLVYSFNAFFLTEQNKDLEFYYPENKMKIWVDGIGITEGSKQKEMAYKFIDFISEPMISTRNTNHNLYASSNDKVRDIAKNSQVFNDINVELFIFPPSESKYFGIHQRPDLIDNKMHYFFERLKIKGE